MVKDSVVKDLEKKVVRLTELLQQEKIEVDVAALMHSNETGEWKILISSTSYDNVGLLKILETMQLILGKHKDIAESIQLEDIIILPTRNPFIQTIQSQLPRESGSTLFTPIGSGLSADYDAYYYRLQ